MCRDASLRKSLLCNNLGMLAIAATVPTSQSNCRASLSVKKSSLSGTFFLTLPARDRDIFPSIIAVNMRQEICLVESASARHLTFLFILISNEVITVIFNRSGSDICVNLSVFRLIDEGEFLVFDFIHNIFLVLLSVLLYQVG